MTSHQWHSEMMSPQSKNRRTLKVPLSPYRQSQQSLPLHHTGSRFANDVGRAPLSPVPTLRSTKPAIQYTVQPPNSRSVPRKFSNDSTSSQESYDSVSSGSNSSIKSSHQSLVGTKQRQYRLQANGSHGLYHPQQKQQIIEKIMGLAPILQLALLFVVLILVLQSHLQAAQAENQLVHYREAESALLLQLQRIENHSIHLHNSLRNRFKTAGLSVPESHALEGHNEEQKIFSNKLHNQVRYLKESIQQESKTEIVKNFGEGPVKLVLELELQDDENTTTRDESSPHKRVESRAGSLRMDILLWPDTPHAIWSLLEQVGRYVWDGAEFRLDSPSTLSLLPSESDPLGRGHLEFAEYLPPLPSDSNQPGPHEAWTVGLREHHETGRLELFINLADNSKINGHESCVGRILGGFDTLQKLLSQTKSEASSSVVKVHHATAAHVSRSEW